MRRAPNLFIPSAASHVRPAPMNDDVAFIEEQVDRHHTWFSKSLPMIASENVISPLAREMLLSDFGDRYAEGLPGERYYQGNVFVDEVERRVGSLAQSAGPSRTSPCTTRSWSPGTS